MSSLSALKMNHDKEDLLISKNLMTTHDLATFFPRKYLDMRKGKVLLDIENGEECAIDGTVVNKTCSGMYPEVWLRDKNGDILTLVWFGNSTYYYDKFKMKHDYRVFGRVYQKYGEYKMGGSNLILELGKDKERIVPVYKQFKGMSQAYLIRYIKKSIAIEESQYIPTIKDMIASDLKLADYFDAIKWIHDPDSELEYRKGRKRIAFEIMFQFYMELNRRHQKIELHENLIVTHREKLDQFISSLPFELTEGQTDAIETIVAQAFSGKRIDTMITGDVGCGKTIVALMAAILMWENGFQTAIMAPTTILAKQHYEEMSSRIPPEWKDAPKFALLTSKTTPKSKERLLKKLEQGEIDILIGTSSILADDLDYPSLGLTIVDEEHKFGTEQKASLEKKCRSGLHHIAMTATPIPRSLARTIYGEDFETISIKSLPKGRKPIITEQSTDRNAVYEKLADEIKKGHQAYIVCPAIDSSDVSSFKDVDSVTKIMGELEQRFKRTHPGIRFESIYGRMAASTIQKKISDFEKKKIDILVSTTIVEVGVNVPNATAIMIASANRFGLAALHQLRGRVGRAGDQGYCYLVTNEYCEKLDILCQTTDGFKIAEEDMKLRGPGDLAGEAQSGDSEAINVILTRPKLAAKVRLAIKNYT